MGLTNEIGGLIYLEPIGQIKERNFRRFMVRASHVKIGNAIYPKLQMLSTQVILDGKRYDTPGAVGRGLKQTRMRLPDRSE